MYIESVHLRSLHLDSGLTWRGGQRQVLALTKGLRELGDEPLVVAPAHTPLADKAHEAGLATAATSMRNDWDIRSSKRIRSLIQTWRPHFVHAHDARSHAVALLALTGSKTPLIVTRRGTFRPKSIRLKYGHRVRRFIAVSNAVKEVMTEAGIEEQRIEVVNSGFSIPEIETPRDWRQELGWPEDSILVGVVGALTPEKGHHRIPHIIELLPDEAVRRTRLIFMGGDRVERTSIGGIETYYAGFVDDIYTAMAGLDILWHPSSTEGLGSATIEALALGVPPIAFAVGGHPEIIEHGKHGFVAPLGDVEAFARYHLQLLNDRSREQIAAAGPARAEDFSVSKMIHNTVKVYERILTP